MRRRLTTSLVALLATLVAAPIASAGFEDAGVRDEYTCDPTYDMYTACAVIKNEVLVWSNGDWSRSRPLRFAGVTATASVGEKDNKPYGWLAQRSIPGNGRGEALMSGGGAPQADGAFLYSLRHVDAPENYQAVVGFRVSSKTAFNDCIVSTFLDCAMGVQQESGRDSKIQFTVTSRPLTIRIQNSMPQDLIRQDGPYLANGLRNVEDDTTIRIKATSGIGSTGVLRSIKKTTTWAAVYRFDRSATENRYDRASLLINIRITEDGKQTGSCTPLFPPSGTRFGCDLEDSGTTKGKKSVIVRVYTP